MTVPVWVEQQDGKFTASLHGSPQVQAEGDTKDAAVAALVSVVQRQRARAELVFVEMPPLPAPALAPDQRTPEEVEAWREVVAEIYRERDEQKRREFGE